MGKRSRDIGKRWENECARKLTGALGEPCNRNLTETREGNSGDVLCESAPLAIQCKAGARPPIYKAVEEAQAVADGRFSIAFIKRQNGRGQQADRLMVLPMEDGLEMLSQLQRWVWK